jgi:hypothetical protein
VLDRCWIGNDRTSAARAHLREAKPPPSPALALRRTGGNTRHRCTVGVFRCPSVIARMTSYGQAKSRRASAAHARPSGAPCTQASFERTGWGGAVHIASLPTPSPNG